MLCNYIFGKHVPTQCFYATNTSQMNRNTRICSVIPILTLSNCQPTNKMTLSWDKWITDAQTETQMSPLDISDTRWTHIVTAVPNGAGIRFFLQLDCQCQDSTVLPKPSSIPLPGPMNPSYNSTLNYQVHKLTRPEATHLPLGALTGD